MSFDGLDIVAALMDAHDRADELCADLKAAGAARAEAERAYRVGKRKGIVFEREHHGSPASLTIDLVKGCGSCTPGNGRLPGREGEP